MAMDIRHVDHDTLVMEMILTAKSGQMDEYNRIKAELERRDRDMFEGVQGD